jgi:hypothetical protein
MIKQQEEAAREGFQAEQGLPADQLFKLFLEESGHLCEKSLRTSLQDSPPTYSSRSYGEFPYVDLLHFSTRKLTYNVRALSMDEALRNSGLLRNYLAPGLGLSDTNRLYNIFTHFHSNSF